MKRIGLILSMLFCITAFANNSYADCPAITPDTNLDGVPVKVLDNNRQLYLVAQPFQYNNTCMAMFITTELYSGHKVVGFVSNYQANDTNEQHFTPPLELCSNSEFEQVLQNPAYYLTLLNQSYENVDLTKNYGAAIAFSVYAQRCPVTCSAGTVLQNNSEWNECVSCPNDQCCLTEETTYTLSDYKDLGNTEYLCPVSSGSGNDEPSAPASSPLRISQSTNNVSATSLASGAYARGAYNANVANINNAIEYIEDSSVATINTAKVSANNMNLSVNGFTPSGTVNVNSNSATINGSFNVPTTVAMFDTWGADTTTNGTLGGIQPANITNGSVSGIDATFTGSASGNLSGTGSFSNASVHVDGWVADNPE